MDESDFLVADHEITPELHEVLENILQLEEGPLEDSVNLSLDLSISGSTRFYNLQVEETVDQLNYDSGEVEPVAGTLGDRIVFSPGENEGYLFMETRDILLEKEKTADNQTPRRIDERIFLDHKDIVGSAGSMLPNNLDEAYNSLTWSPRSGGPLTDRASSPSAASVTSYQSTCSNVSITGRRYLEWDYGSDLGPQYQTQGEAAQSLSKLEKLAIGSYSEYLREEPDGKKMKEKQKVSKQDYLPDSEGEEMRANRFSKFADSLMKQRQLQQQRRSVSRETVRLRSDNVAGDIGSEEGGRGISGYVEGLEIESGKSPMKSSSMSDIPARPTHNRRSRSVSAHSLAQLSLNMSGPSSSSSAGTVVAVQHMSRPSLPVMFGDLSIISTSPRSLPPHLQDMEVVTSVSQECGIEKDKDGEEVLVRQEVFVAYVVSDPAEVIAVEKSDSESERVETSLSTLAEDLCVSEKSRQSTPPQRPTVAWTQDVPSTSTSNFERFLSEPKSVTEDDIQFPIPPRSKPINHSSDQSSVPTTSDEEVDGPRQAELVLRNHRNYDGDTSTLESVQMVDRAKSFEYIPGASFQLQENSSSYEYLPGHLVADRPPTVLTRRPDSAQLQLSVAGSSVELVRSRDSLALAEIGADLDSLSAELKEKSEELLSRNISQTKHFFKKLKGYIKFIATPSLTVEDSRVKQELAERIMALLSTEESRLAVGFSGGLNRRALSSNSDSLSSSIYNQQSRPEKKVQRPVSPMSNYSSQSTSSRSKYSASSRSSSGHPTTREITTQSKDKNTGRNMSTESSTRMLERSVESSVSGGEVAKYSCDQISLSSEVKESDNSSRLSEWKKERTNSEVKYQLKKKKRDQKRQLTTPENIEIIQKLQDQRMMHMAKMKKEIQKLEKLDSWIAGAATGKLISLSEVSLSSSAMSVECGIKARIKKNKSEKYGHVDNKYESMKAKSLKLAKEIPENLTSQSRNIIIDVEKYGAVSLRPEKDPAVLNLTKDASNSSSPRIEDASHHNLSNFGQMFPSPCPSEGGLHSLRRRVSTVTTQTIARVTTGQQSVEIQTDRTVSSEDMLYTTRQRIKPDRKSPRKQRRILPESVAKQKPVAYYLPMDNLSPIRIGRRVLREIRGDNENVFHSADNRNILSSYISSLDTQPLKKHPQQALLSPSPRKHKKMNLQEALLLKRKDFLITSEERVVALHRAKDARILRNAKQTAWLEEIASQTPRSQKLAEPSFTPVPVVRVFNHRDMVRATREKCTDLPEVQNMKLNAKNSEKQRLNRLMAQIYSRRLQRKVVRGQVSLTHHQMVV